MNLRSFVIFTTILINLFGQTNSNQLKIYHRVNITHPSCGVNLVFAKPLRNRCLKWHKSSYEEKQELKNIENGRNAEYSEFPYTVLIYLEKAKFQSCTGVIINERWVVTTAHCLIDSSPKNIKIYTGLIEYHGFRNWMNYVTVKNVYPHKGNTEILRGWFDIGLIELETELTLDTGLVNSVCLPDDSFRMDGSELAIFSGWGRTLHSTEQRLKTTKIKISAPHSYLRIRSYEVVDGTICGGDSGGPLVQYVNGRAVLIGIAISGHTKDETSKCVDKLSIFTAVPYNVNWIVETILNNTLH